MRLTVAVCTRNSSGRIGRTMSALRACFAAAGDRDEIDLLVVANACTDDTVSLLRRDWSSEFARRLTILEEPRLGVMYARQRVCAEVRSEAVVFCDDDVVPDTSCLRWVLESLRSEPRVVGGGGRILPRFLDGAAWPEWMADEWKHYLAIRPMEDGPVYLPPGSDYRYAPITAFCWWRSSVLAVYLEHTRRYAFPLGHTGDELWAGEDTEITYLALKTGGVLKYDPRVQVEHCLSAGRLEAPYLARLAYWAQRSAVRVEHRFAARAWPLAARFVLKGFWLDPLAYAAPLLRGGRPAVELLKREYPPAGECRAWLSACAQAGYRDEKVAKFLMPWRQ